MSVGTGQLGVTVEPTVGKGCASAPQHRYRSSRGSLITMDSRRANLVGVQLCCRAAAAECRSWRVDTWTGGLERELSNITIKVTHFQDCLPFWSATGLPEKIVMRISSVAINYGAAN